MGKFTYDFEGYSKDEWLEIIKKSLKKGSIKDFVWQIDKEVQGKPFAHKEDTPEDYAPFAIKDNNWKIGLDYSLIENIDFNKYLKSHMNFGIESTVVNINHSQIDINELFNGVGVENKELIFNTRYGVDQILFLEHLKDYFEERGFDINSLNIVLRLPINRPGSILELEEYCKIHFPNISFYFKTERALSKTPVDYLSESLNTLSSYIKKSKIDKNQLNWLLKKLKFHFFMNGTILADISTLRAFKILWKNYLKSYDAEDLCVKIILGINHDSYTDDENDDLIIATILSMTGAIAGVDSINIAPKTDGIKDIKNTMRLMLNIQNILKLESNMSLVNDALAGSYSIEDATNQIAKKAWDKVNE